MALSDDQRAMLRLLAQREQGYEDLAALMGLSVDEVRAKVKDALDALEEGEVAPPLPPEPVATPAPTPKPPEPAPPAAVEAPMAAEEPVPAPEPKADKPKPPSPAARRSASSPPRISLPSGQGARAAIAAGIAVVALVIVVVIVSGGGGGSSSDTSTSAATATTPSESTTGTEATAATTGSEKQTQAVLSEVGGSGASGTAVFGRVKNSLALQVVAEGLEPTSKGQTYTVWVADSPQKMLPLASTEVPKSGKIAAQFEVPTEVLAYLAKGTFDQIAVTATDEAQLKASLTKATKEKKSPSYTGTAVLLGPITGPIVGAALKEKK